MAIDTGLIKQLRERTGAGVMDCREALSRAQGDLEQATSLLRQKNTDKAGRKTDRETPEGLISSYIHPGNRVGVLIEVNCETDFVARTQEFQDLIKDLMLQIAGADPAPRYVCREDMSPEELEAVKASYTTQARELKKPDSVLERIVHGRLEKFITESCLWEQSFIKDPEKRVGDLVTQKIAKLGENIRVRRFARYQLGGDA